MRYISESWVSWVGLVSIGVVWGLPRIPYYQDWMPYGYHFGGMALVLLYLSLGAGSLGIYGLMIGLLHRGSAVSRNNKIVRIGFTSLVLAAGCVWCYMQLMGLALKFS